MFKKKNYKLFIGIIVGIIISLTITMASAESYSSTASDVYYDTDIEQILSHEYNNVQDALDEIYISNNCPYGYHCTKMKNNLEPRDYVSYTPTKTSVTVDASIVGTSTNPTIYPSELDSWIVLNKNADGTIDIVSEYLPSKSVSIRGEKGYFNLVGYLNTLAKQYETDGITVGSRSFGYNGQTEYISNTTTFKTPTPWPCSTGTTGCTPIESLGGGDTLYLKDYNNAIDAIGTVTAIPVGSASTEKYAMATRTYQINATGYYGGVRAIYSTETVRNYAIYQYFSPDFLNSGSDYYYRPIVTLSADLTYDGSGTSEEPWRIVS